MYLVFFVFIFKIIHGAQLMNCPRNQLRFEKIIGLRPSGDINGYLLHKHENYEPVTLDCLTKCSSNNNCLSFVIFYNSSECFWFDITIDGFDENDNVIDPNVAWFEKTCLSVNNCDKSWVFERIPGTTLVGNNLHKLPNRVTRQECQQSCLKNNVCRSVKFRIKDDGGSRNTIGSCVLSDTDRHLMPNSFRASNYDEEYMENQCTNVTASTFCAYEEYDHSILAHIDIEHFNKTRPECEKICEETTVFNCRGYSLIPTTTYGIYTCLIHSENSKIHGPKLLIPIDGANFYEKARCLNISVTCSETHVMVHYKPEINFNGKLYMNGYSQNLECYVKGNGVQTVNLKIPLFGNRCGIREAKSPAYLNRTLFSGTMILQYNSLIQTQGDRVIKVGCIFSNDTKVVLGTGINFANLTYPNKGTTIVNSSTVHPTVEMRIIDFYSEKEVSDTQIGQELQLVIEVQPADGPFDIWAGHLIAMTEDGQDSILLLDDRGCPTNPTIFPGLTKIYNNQTRRLVSHFYAFKFTSSAVIRFSVIVQFCPTYCTPSNCGSNSTPNGRRRREILSETTNATVTELNKHQFDNQGKVPKMPLEFVIVVRNPKISSNKLVHTENNKIVIAGYDLQTNEVCIDFSLLIGIIIVWIGTQIILLVCGLLMIKRYKKYYRRENTNQSLEELHKNFGLGFSNLENRRVHWADT
ncbi:hypothetical protein RN001_012312 [Aquatica leii]|uniref:Uncharacterized protein n=1 Tax=Aquatica leii TaxID=1421715 RepID=A0AAN7NYC0_9COLE|nr:hypothetical protein RN001_012312 [Aquatica leii]